MGWPVLTKTLDNGALLDEMRPIVIAMEGNRSLGTGSAEFHPLLLQGRYQTLPAPPCQNRPWRNTVGFGVFGRNKIEHTLDTFDGFPSFIIEPRA